MARAPPPPEYIFRGHSEAVHSVCFDEAGEHLYTGDAGGHVLRWSLATMQSKRVLSADGEPAHAGHAVLSLACAGGLLVTQGREGLARVWSPSSLSMLHEVPAEGLSFCRVSVAATSSSDVLIAAASVAEDRRVNVWRVSSDASNAPVHHASVDAPDERCGAALSLALIGPDRLLTGHEGGELLLWRLSSDASALCARLRLHTEPVLSLSVHLPRHHVVCASPEQRIARVTFANDALILVDNIDVASGGVAQVDVRADGKLAACAGWDGRLWIMGLGPPRPLAVVSAHREGLMCVACAPSGSLIAAGSKDARVSLWKLF